MLETYRNQNAYFGDIHNHCAVGYGHGSIEEAFHNARLQLDFACVTVHAFWHDIPDEDPRLDPIVDYHNQGFGKTAAAWQHVQDVVQANYNPGNFVSFLGFEWHSRHYGDHNVYYKEPPGEILRAADLPALRQALRQLRDAGRDVMVAPHHIGYKQGYRGINWATFDPTFSPIVEIYSMHGSSESGDAPYPYLHTMGPRDWHSTYQYGLQQGHIAGAVGSTDHHSAHPGSYGHGRLGLWAADLSRDAVWDAIQARRTYALTGDNIRLAFSLNGSAMGQVLPATRERNLELAVEGGAALDYVEIVHNNRVLQRLSPGPVPDDERFAHPLKIHFEVGWGKKGQNMDWDVTLEVCDGQLLDVEPRFRGHEIVAPQATEESTYAFSNWQRVGDNGLAFTTRTWGNATTTTASTQGLSLTVAGEAHTVLRGTVNGQAITARLGDLLDGPRAEYLGGFLTPAYAFQKAVPRAAYTARLAHTHHSESGQRDWYYARVRQRNGQWAWSSPIWVEGQAD